MRRPSDLDLRHVDGVGRGVPAGPAALAGVLAAGTALASGELTAAVAGPRPSLVTAVGDQFVDRFAASLKDLAIRMFGENHKLALIVGIVVVALALGAGLGLVARRRFVWAAAGLTAFGGLGLVAGLRDPLGTAGAAWAAALVAVAAGIATLGLLLYLAPRPDDGTGAGRGVPGGADPVEDPRRPHASRRAFFGWSGTVGAWAALAASGAQSLRSRSTIEAERAEVDLPAPVRSADVPADDPFAVPGLSPYVVPNDDFFRIDTALTVPQVEAASWRLRVDGLVDRPYELTYDELSALDMVETPVTLACVSNLVGGDLVGNAVWLGVPLVDLLEEAGVRPEATQLMGHSVDEFTAGFPTELALDGRTALVAVGMNGEPLPARHGYPARLVVSGLYGYVSATKWLARIELTRWEDADGYWIPRGWAKEAPIKIASRIDVPASGARLSPGPVPVAGVAWSPSIGIAAVEVRVDDGPWEAARLGEAVDDDTWVQWVYDWDAAPGSHELTVRAIGADGEVQTAETSRPEPDGATGHHRRTVDVEA